MRKDSFSGVQMKCVVCTKPIPTGRKWDAITCSKECTKARRDFGRSRIDQRECRYCQRPSTPDEQTRYKRWRKWESTHDPDSIEGRMTSEEKIERAYKLAALEMRSNPKHWMYLSFAKPDTGFAGCCYVEAHGLITAVIRANELDINPHGEVMGVDVPDEHLIPEEYRNRLLTKEEHDKSGITLHSLANLDAEAEAKAEDALGTVPTDEKPQSGDESA
jgi:hypothetical protein